jgi:hypothetical protein
MALKPDYRCILDDISFFVDVTASKGELLCLNTGGSGAALGDGNAVAYKYLQGGTGAGHASIATGIPSNLVPLGITFTDVVNYDLTKQPINWHKDEVQVGSKVRILRVGWCVTDRVYPGLTVAAGNPCFAGVSGYVTNVETVIYGTNGANVQKIGQFLSKPNAEGFAKVAVNLPG